MPELVFCSAALWVPPLRRRAVPVRRLSAGAMWVLAAAIICADTGSHRCAAGVVVLANRTAEKVEYAFAPPGGPEQRRTITPGDVVSIPAEKELYVAFPRGGKLRQYTLPVNTIHYFMQHGGSLDLVQISLSQSSQPSASESTSERANPPHGKDSAPLGTAPQSPAAAAGIGVSATSAEAGQFTVIPVKILVDQHEPTVRRVWEKRLRERVAAASAIFERDCRVRFEVVAADTWETDNAAPTFEHSLRDFEKKVSPAPARLALGFTSRYEIVPGQVHMGGTHAPLRPHILIREWSPAVTASLRLEILVHELGHFLGAVHSPEEDSVMRPRLVDHRSHDRRFRIGLDPVNTLIVCLVAQELRSRPLTSLSQLRPETKSVLREAYRALGRTMPGDESAAHCLALLDRPDSAPLEPVRYPAPLAEAVRAVVEAVAAASRENARRPALVAGDKGAGRALGDGLTELYVRTAAGAASKLPPEQAAVAFLLGLGVALDDTGQLRQLPLTRDLCRQVESADARIERLAVLGLPTMRGRHDLAQHFVLSAALTAVLGPHAVEAIGLAKELHDSQSGSGFSFADLAANMAGVEMAKYVLRPGSDWQKQMTQFAVRDYLPPVADLREGMSWQQFVATYGSPGDARFQAQRKKIAEMIRSLPAYSDGGPGAGGSVGGQ